MVLYLGWEEGQGEGSVGGGTRGGVCGRRDKGRGLWEEGQGEGSVGGGTRGGVCGRRDKGRGLWESLASIEAFLKLLSIVRYFGSRDYGVGILNCISNGL